MSAPTLDQAWLDRRVEHLGALPEVPGATARLLHVVAGGPDGELRYVESFVDGRLAEATLGAGEADLELSYKHDIAVAVASGELDLVAGFMQGRVKMVGSSGTLMALLPALSSPEHAAAVSAVAAGS